MRVSVTFFCTLILLVMIPAVYKLVNVILWDDEFDCLRYISCLELERFYISFAITKPSGGACRDEQW